MTREVAMCVCMLVMGAVTVSGIVEICYLAFAKKKRALSAIITVIFVISTCILIPYFRSHTNLTGISLEVLAILMATGNAFAPVHIVLLGYKSAREIINRKGEYNRYVS